MKKTPRVRAYHNSLGSYLNFNYGNKTVEICLLRYRAADQIENYVTLSPKYNLNKKERTKQVWLSRKEARKLVKLAEQREKIQRIMRNVVSRISWESA